MYFAFFDAKHQSFSEVDFQMAKMTNQEILEFAAKSIGLNAKWAEFDKQKMGGMLVNGSGWNPISNSGDAFELAAALDMNTYHAANCAFALPSGEDGPEQSVPHGTDKSAAMRLAITKLAATIGMEIW